jgi:hypothetical protein
MEQSILQLYSRGKSTWYPSDRRLDGFRNPCERYGEVIILAPTRTRSLIPRSSIPFRPLYPSSQVATTQSKNNFRKCTADFLDGKIIFIITEPYPVMKLIGYGAWTTRHQSLEDNETILVTESDRIQPLSQWISRLYSVFLSLPSIDLKVSCGLPLFPYRSLRCPA